MDLPDLAIRKVAEFASVGDLSLQTLVALAGINRSWRSIIRTLDPQSLSFNSKARFSKRVSLAGRNAFFLSAAQLFAGISSIELLGEAVTDAVLLEVARRSECRLTTLHVEGTNSLSDTSLIAIALMCPGLKHLHLKDLGNVRGAFLPALLKCCTSLESLSLHGLPKFIWEFAGLCYDQADSLPSLQHLTLVNCHLEAASPSLFARFSSVQVLSCSSAASAVWAAARHCPNLRELRLTISFPSCADDCLPALLHIPQLRVLELSPRGFCLMPEQLALVGMLPLEELRLDSHAFRIQPMNRVNHSHIKNEGVKALVDGICTRCTYNHERQPFKLSLCGATAITHDAVSALLRLPLLSGLLLDGCFRISSIDKMRLVAKVKAGRELLDGMARKKAGGGGRAGERAAARRAALLCMA